MYLAAGVLALVPLLLDPSTRTASVPLLAVGGLAGELSVVRRSRLRLVLLSGYDLIVALTLAALGIPLVAILVSVAVSAALSLGQPERRGSYALVAALAGAAIAILAVEVAGIRDLTPFAAGQETLGLFVLAATLATLSAGMAWTFGGVGMRIRLLSLAEGELRTSLEASPIATIVAEGDAIVFANPAASLLAGRPLIGESLVDVFGLGHRPLQEGRTVRTILTTRDPLPVTVDVQAADVLFKGRPSLQVAFVDVSEITTVQEALASTRRQLDLLFERIPVALYRSTPDGTIVAANQALADLLGATDPASLLSVLENARSHYEDPARREAWLRQFDDGTDVVMDFEMHLVKPDGSTMIVLDSSRAVRDEQGEIQFFEGVLIDVTVQREVELARERVAEILEATSDFVWLCDDDDRVIRMNAAMKRFLGVGDEVELAGLAAGEILVTGAGSDELRAWRAAGAPDRVWSGEIEIRSLDGRVVLVSAVAQQHRHYWSVLARDITEERRTANQLERLMVAKDEFIASVSHELRTPLTAVVGLASELSLSFDDLDDSTKHEFIRLVADQASEVAAIVEDLLVAARADTESITLVTETVDVRASVDMVLAAIPETKRDLFEVHGESIALGDAQRVRQIIRNLLSNALRYGELPGTIRIATSGDDVTIAVSDKGPGIPPELVDRIFQPYERAHAAASQPNSVGLGLSVSRWLAEKMGGSLTYENGHMSTFLLRLPARP